jgi:aminopeptidase-like protein|tara:strand:- start:10 stop:228 length:219 start_codon:yes stop_codon:yes gene_type:complete
LALADSEIIKYLKELESDIKNLKHELLKICWFMRGGVTYQESLNMDIEERKIVAKIVKENLETTKKSGRDFF